MTSTATTRKPSRAEQYLTENGPTLAVAVRLIEPVFRERASTMTRAALFGDLGEWGVRGVRKDTPRNEIIDAWVSTQVAQSPERAALTAARIAVQQEQSVERKCRDIIAAAQAETQAIAHRLTELAEAGKSGLTALAHHINTRDIEEKGARADYAAEYLAEIDAGTDPRDAAVMIAQRVVAEMTRTVRHSEIDPARIRAAAGGAQFVRDLTRILPDDIAALVC